MKFILESKQMEKFIFEYIEHTIGNIRPLDENKYPEWCGYTNDFCEQHDTFLWGYKKDELFIGHIKIYFWGTAFDFDGLKEIFNLNSMQIHRYVESYIQQYYKQPITLI